MFRLARRAAADADEDALAVLGDRLIERGLIAYDASAKYVRLRALRWAVKECGRNLIASRRLAEIDWELLP